MSIQIKKDMIVIYEGKTCKIISASDTRVVLKNLSRKDLSDWDNLEISIDEIKK